MYQDNLAQKLETNTHTDIDVEWNRIEEGIRSAASNAFGVIGKSNAHNYWISTRVIQLIEQRHPLPFEKSYNSARSLKQQLTRELKIDRKPWWNEIARQMEIAAAAGNSDQLFKLICITGGRPNNVSETIYEPDGTLIVNRDRRLVRWMEHFRAQFNCPASVNTDSNIAAEPEWSVTLELPMDEEITITIKEPKRGEAAGPDELPPHCSKMGGCISSDAHALYVKNLGRGTHSLILKLFTDFTDLQERL